MCKRKHGDYLVGIVGRDIVLAELDIGRQALVSQHNSLRSAGSPRCIIDYGEIPCIVCRVGDILRSHSFREFRREQLGKLLQSLCHLVIGSIKDAEISNEKPEWSQSSVILRLLSGEHVTEDIFLQEKFSPREFFVCVYYELLLESILN